MAVTSPMPLRGAALSRTHVAFEYADDIWTVGREGGDARRLTDYPAKDTLPHFSPDGSRLAFARQNPASGPLAWDVYVMPAAGGEAVRLTYHPDLEAPAGWTPDGKSVLFYTLRDRSHNLGSRLYTVPADGGREEPLPLPQGWAGSFSPDQTRIAYTPLLDPLSIFQFRNYRGGGASKIWLARLSDGTVEEIPRGEANDLNPIWVGERVYFLSDRAGPYNLFAYDTRTKAVTQLTRFEKYDVRSASFGGDAVLLTHDGALHLFDTRTNQTRRLDVRVPGDFPQTKPRAIDAGQSAENILPSPDGKHLLLGARGEILTARVSDGEVANLTRTPAAAERGAAWSPDGRRLAYFSDESGELELHVRTLATAAGGATSGGGAASGAASRGRAASDTAAGGVDSSDASVRRFTLDRPSSVYAELLWSPDSSKLAFTDAWLNLRYLDLATGVVRRVDASTHTDGGTFMHPAWSPDGRWLAYAKYGVNRVRTVTLFSLETGKTYGVSDQRIDAQQPTFDRGGEYLYFIGSNQTGLVESQGMSGFPFRSQVARTLYAVVLNRESPSPLAPRAGEDDMPRVRSIRIDPEGIAERVLPLSVGVGNPGRLLAGTHGTLFVVEGGTLHRFRAGAQGTEKFVEGAGTYRVTPDGKHLLLRRQGRWAMVATDAAPPKPDDGRFTPKSLELSIDPRAEWRMLYEEAWRRMRVYFYDRNLHGINLGELKTHYAAFLPNISTRDGLNEVFKAMFSHLSTSHMGVSGGDMPAPQGLQAETTGLLGADYETDSGRYRIRRVLRGDPVLGVVGPLAQPGLGAGVREGEYLLAVEGVEVKADDNLYRHFLNRASKPLKIRVGARADGAGAREVRVVPVSSEYSLRQIEWVRENRRRVEELSGGRLAYVYMVNTSDDGYNAFNRDFYAQLDRQGLILDARFNEGGRAADHVIDTLRRMPLYRAALRAGEDIRIPTGVIDGPKVVLTNESAGSGGDTLPWMAKRTGVATVVGTRTSGAGIGASTHNLLDGGSIRVPDWGWYDPAAGTWLVENRGTTPDVVVENTPADWRRGRDPQLERAVAIALEQLKKRGAPPPPRRPKYPTYKE